jgi:hypothetical protein
MPSVSGAGRGHEPQSRWSRPITMGAETSPRATRSLMTRLNCSRSHNRASKPCRQTDNGTLARVLAPSNGPVALLSGKVSSRARSMRNLRVAEGSPAEGPLPSQNNGWI